MVPATQEAEAEESLEPRRQRLLWAEFVPLHSSLGDNSKIPPQEKKKSHFYLEQPDEQQWPFEAEISDSGADGVWTPLALDWSWS